MASESTPSFDDLEPVANDFDDDFDTRDWITRLNAAVNPFDLG